MDTYTLMQQSRFAGLKIEDDDYPSSDNQKSQKNDVKNNVKKPELQKKPKTNNTKPQTISKKKKNKQNSTTEQWEMWKIKDEEMVHGNYENELQEALYLSKLDYEEKKDVYKKIKQDVENEKQQMEQAARGIKKQKKKNVMSLDQFNDMMNDTPKIPPEENKETTVEENKPSKKNKEFFERVSDETKDELLKAKINDRVMNRQTVPDDIITKIQYVEALARKDKELAALKQEVERLNRELLTVKCRNKKLCHILGQGEMKDKAEVLEEVERLRTVQTEMSNQISALHSDLERERSKNTDPRAKDKRKKTANGDKDK